MASNVSSGDTPFFFYFISSAAAASSICIRLSSFLRGTTDLPPSLFPSLTVTTVCDFCAGRLSFHTFSAHSTAFFAVLLSCLLPVNILIAAWKMEKCQHENWATFLLSLWLGTRKLNGSRLVPNLAHSPDETLRLWQCQLARSPRTATPSLPSGRRTHLWPLLGSSSSRSPAGPKSKLHPGTERHFLLLLSHVTHWAESKRITSDANRGRATTIFKYPTSATYYIMFIYRYFMSLKH